MSVSILTSPFFIVNLLNGSIFILGGIIMRKYPPKKINHWYGYRTPASQKSQERWDFAQIYSAKEFIKAGIVLVLLGFPGTFMLPHSPTGAFAAILLMLIASFILIYRVERAIKKKFGK